MIKNTLFLIFPFLFLCVTFNYTFPLQKNPCQVHRNDPKMHSQLQNRISFFERSKKMASNLENAIRKIKDSTQDIGKTIYGQINPNSQLKYLTDEDLRQYEQLVIMKKYPYIDLKEIEMKLSATNKNARHNNGGLQSIVNLKDPYVCDANDDSINVEILNRGLSGVAIPNKQTTTFQVSLNNNLLDAEKMKTSGQNSDIVMNSLKNDVMEYLKRKGFDRALDLKRIEAKTQYD